MKKWILIILIPLLGSGVKRESMSIEKVRISQLPVASANEVDDDIWMIFNTADGKTKRMQAGAMKAAAGCELMCHEILIPTAEVLTLGTIPVAAGITIPAGSAIALQSGVMWIDFNSVAYATESDVLIIPNGGTTNLVDLSAVLGTSIDMSGAFFPSAVNPLEERIVTDADLMITTPTGVDPTLGDSDLHIKFYYFLIEL